MKKVLRIAALAMACMMLFAACKKEESKPTSTTPPAQQQTTESKPVESKPVEEPKVDPKEEMLAKAEQDAVYVKPHLVLDPDLPAQDIINAVAELF